MADALNHFTYLLTYLKVPPALQCTAEVRSRDVILVYYVIITSAATSVSMTRRVRQASCWRHDSQWFVTTPSAGVISRVASNHATVAGGKTETMGVFGC